MLHFRAQNGVLAQEAIFHNLCFVHKSRKFSNFEPMLDYIMLCNFGTVCPIFPKIAPNLRKTSKKNVMKARGAEIFSMKLPRETSSGRGGFCPPPPPPALLGLKDCQNYGKACSIWAYMWMKTGDRQMLASLW